MTWSFRFNDSFYRDRRETHVSMKVSSRNAEVSITDLDAYPLQYASEETKLLLTARGETFWRCRLKKLVSYHDKIGKYGVGSNGLSCNTLLISPDRGTLYG